MARISLLLRYARIGDRRRAASTQTHAGKLAEMLVIGCLGITLLNLLWHIAFGLDTARLGAARYLFAILAGLLFLVPLSYRTSMPPEVIAFRPVSVLTVRLVTICSYWQNAGAAGLLILAAVSSCVVLFRTPSPILHFGEAVCSCLLAIACGTGTAITATHIFKNAYPLFCRQSGRRITYWPLLRKELFMFCGLIDPYGAFLFTSLLGATELSARWLGVAKSSMIVYLAVVFFFLPFVLMPFGLDTDFERARYKLIPLSTSRILIRKHAAAAILILICTSPLTLASLWNMNCVARISFIEALASLCIGAPLAGLVLSKLDFTQTPRLYRGTYAGNLLSTTDFLRASALIALPLALLLSAYHRLPVWAAQFVAIALLASLLYGYGFALKQLSARSCRSN